MEATIKNGCFNQCYQAGMCLEDSWYQLKTMMKTIHVKNDLLPRLDDNAICEKFKIRSAKETEILENLAYLSFMEDRCFSIVSWPDGVDALMFLLDPLHYPDLFDAYERGRNDLEFQMLQVRAESTGKVS